MICHGFGIGHLVLPALGFEMIPSHFEQTWVLKKNSSLENMMFKQFCVHMDYIVFVCSFVFNVFSSGCEQELELLVEGLRIEVKELNTEVDRLKGLLEESQAKTSQLHQLQELRSVNLSLTDELREANQQNLEYVYKIETLEKQLKDNSGEKEQTKLIEALKNKMEKVLKEKELAIMKESDAKAQSEEMKVVIDSLQTKLKDIEEEHAKLVQEHGELFIEYGKLRKRLQQDEDKTTFREFVALKRELVAVKNENEILRLKVRTSSDSLPMLKEDLPPPVTKPMTKKGKKKLLAITLSHGTGPSME